MISVVVCSRDRAPQLAQCLARLAQTRGASSPDWQVVVVDNGSRDDTRERAARFAHLLPLTYVFAPQRGLAHARNRGIAAARHALIAFTDDDCLVDPGWVPGIVDAFARHPAWSIVGGRVELADAADPAVSVRTHDRAEAVGTAAGILALMSGANMAFRREVFERAGVFDPAFGKGRRIGSAEDVDMLYRALKAGCTIAYAPQIVVRHAHGRRSAAALAGVERDYVTGRGAFYRKFIRDRDVARMAYWEVHRLLREGLRLRGGAASRRLLRCLAAGALYASVDRLHGGAPRRVVQ